MYKEDNFLIYSLIILDILMLVFILYLIKHDFDHEYRKSCDCGKSDGG